jgi:hypothetical protein
MRKSEMNPGVLPRGEVQISGAVSRREAFDAVAALERALARRGQQAIRDGDALQLEDAQLTLLALVAKVEARPDGGASTATTVEVFHPCRFPGGAFEYQHSTGKTVDESIEAGFDQWAQVDLAPLLDSLVAKPRVCPTLVMEFPANANEPPRRRRVVLGPVRCMQQRPRAADGEGQCHEPCCPCCLITNSLRAFDDLLRSDATFAIRLFAARAADGSASADCRVNGRDHEAGMSALREYARRWPDAGIEYRKQYAVVHTL